MAASYHMSVGMHKNEYGGAGEKARTRPKLGSDTSGASAVGLVDGTRGVHWTWRASRTCSLLYRQALRSLSVAPGAFLFWHPGRFLFGNRRCPMSAFFSMASAQSEWLTFSPTPQSRDCLGGGCGGWGRFGAVVWMTQKGTTGFSRLFRMLSVNWALYALYENKNP